MEPKPSKKYVYVAKKESEHKRETRSRHEKRRREEMNEVFSEMMDLLPEDVQKDVFKIQKADQKPKKPDKCFIISNAVEFIRKNVKKTIQISDPITEDIYELTNCFVLTLQNLIIRSIEGDHRTIFDMEKYRMIGKDLRCFLDFDSARKLSFLPANYTNLISLRSFMAKEMNCKIRNSQQNPSETLLVCIPDPTTVIQPTVPPPTTVTPTRSKLEVERPILAALLRRSDPPDEELERRRETEMRERREKERERVLKMEMEQRRQRDRQVSLSQVHVTPIVHCDSSTSSFLSPSSCTSSHPPATKKLTKKAEKAVETGKRKRLRSMNAIVESYSLDDVDVEAPESKKSRKSKKEEKKVVYSRITSTTTPTLTTMMPSVMSTPVTIPTTTFINPIPSTSNHPFDVLAPNYKDIWLRLQSERLLLEERIVAKEGELKNLMARTLPQYFPTLPHYNIAQSTLDILHQL